MTVNDVTVWARRQVPESRRQHVAGTAAIMRRLAECWQFSLDEGEAAAWLHDICRDWPAGDLLRTVEQSGVSVNPLEKAYPVLLHGPAAACLYRDRFGETQTIKSVFEAVYYHTTGRPCMGVVEASLFLADAIEPGRHYPGVEELRAMSITDLAKAVQLTLGQTMRYLLERQLPLHPLTVEAYNEALITKQHQYRSNKS